MHRLSTSFVLGYHGCPEAVAHSLLAGEPFEPSKNDYDWLGPGTYFWQSNPRRALQFASEKRAREKAKWQPNVIGAVVELGLCLDLTTEASIEEVRQAHQHLSKLQTVAGAPLPINSGGNDRLVRKLDCAVITTLYDIRKNLGEPACDTVLGIFEEGGPLYENSGFRTKTHVQICVCNPAMIKGVFRVPALDL
jgi:hypothetical protein